MLEKLADYDDQLMEQLLEDIAPPRDKVFADLVQDMRKGLICPVLIGSAERGNGVGRLLKAIRHETPDIAETRARLGVAAGGDAIVQILKTLHTTHGGKLSIARVLGGTIGDGAELLGPNGPAGRVSGVFRVMGQQAAKREPAQPGETVGLGKLEGARTGMTLSTGKTAPPQIASLRQPDPVIGTAVSSAERKDDVKLSSAIAKIIEEDPSLRVTHVQDTGETVMEGQGEMHLRVALERMTGKYGIAVKTHEPAIPYKETIRGATTVRGRHKKQSGGHGQFGDVVLEIKPLPRGSGFQFSESITGGAVPRNYFSSIEEGVAEYLNKGPLGFRVVDVSVRLTDGSYHSVDSSDMAFRTAAQIGMREGMAAVQAGAARTDPQGGDRGAVGGDRPGQRHRLAAPRPAPRLRCPAGLEGLGRGRGDDPAGGDPRPDRRAALGDRRRRHLQGDASTTSPSSPAGLPTRRSNAQGPRRRRRRGGCASRAPACPRPRSGSAGRRPSGVRGKPHQRDLNIASRRH